MSKISLVGWVEEEKVFLNMIDDRNKTSHIYDKDTANEIFLRIKQDYLPAIKGILNKLSCR